MALSPTLNPPSHDSKRGRGGWHEGASIAERNALAPNLIRDGMIYSIPSLEQIWFRKAGTWVPLIEADNVLYERIVFLEEELSKRLTESEVRQLVADLIGSGGGGTDPLVVTLEDGSPWFDEDGEAIEAE